MEEREEFTGDGAGVAGELWQTRNQVLFFSRGNGPGRGSAGGFTPGVVGEFSNCCLLPSLKEGGVGPW